MFNIQNKNGVVRPLKLTLADLKQRFPKTEVTTTIQCGGNRRSGLNAVQKTSGISWQFGAVSNAKWGGVLLRDLLSFALHPVSPELCEREGIRHVQFLAIDGLAASIPIETALNPYGDVLIAYEMNGEDLPTDHGYPIRAIVPGHVGIRNVKWVKSIVLSSEEAEGPWQRGIAYKGFAPGVKGSDFGKMSKEELEAIQSMQTMPVTSVICKSG